ncbi:MAG TPA: hypothetical protein PK819_11010, partial [Thermomicrobiales bacterium]|nr:hypothetical protein [Thermomicrobiales bacterium]
QDVDALGFEAIEMALAGFCHDGIGSGGAVDYRRLDSPGSPALITWVPPLPAIVHKRRNRA